MDYHKPVMVKEVLDFLNISPGKKFIDATVGGGGHTEAILVRGGEVLGIDQDPGAIEIAEKRLKARFDESKARQAYPGVFDLVRSNFTNLAEVASKKGFKKVDGILFDLGFASFQVDDSTRGLSFNQNAPLDMRLDPGLEVTAADLVNTLSERQLYNLLVEFGEERHARAIARAIVRRRSTKPVETTLELADVVEGVYRTKNRAKRIRHRAIDPATKTFLALRSVVNSEAFNLKSALPQAEGLLKKGGRLVVLSFHSGEDRIVKNFMREAGKEGGFRIFTKKPSVPSEKEIEENPRARSAKLRAGEKIW